MALNKRVTSAILLSTGNLAVFDLERQQIPELQGSYSIDTHQRILLEATDDCKFEGFHILPYGFTQHARDFADYFRGKNLSWEEIQEFRVS